MAIFGVIGHLDFTYFSVISTGVILVLLLLERIVKFLQRMADKHGYDLLMAKTVNELMVLGIISFITTIITSQLSLSYYQKDPGYLSFEFYHLTILFIGFAFVLQAFLLVRFASLLSVRLARYRRISSESLIGKFGELSDGMCGRALLFLHAPFLLPFPKCREAMEYKILERFFIKMYDMPYEFDFSVYVSAFFKRYVIELVEVPAISWLLIEIVFIVYLAGTKYTIWPLFPHESPESLLCSGLMFAAGNIFYLSLMYMVSSRYMSNLMMQALKRDNIPCSNSAYLKYEYRSVYPDSLQIMINDENAHKTALSQFDPDTQDITVNLFEFSDNSTSAATSQLYNMSSSGDALQSPHCTVVRDGRVFFGSGENSPGPVKPSTPGRKLSSPPPFKIHHKQKDSLAEYHKHLNENKTMSKRSGGDDEYDHFDDQSDTEEEEVFVDDINLIAPVMSASTYLTQCGRNFIFGSRSTPSGLDKDEPNRSTEPEKSAKRNRRESLAEFLHSSSGKRRLAPQKLDLNHIFFNSYPQVYFVFVQFGLLLQCAYISLWCTTFLSLASETEYPAAWLIALTLPMVVKYWLVCEVLQLAVYLKVMLVLNKEIAINVCEQALIERDVTSRLRQQFRKRLQEATVDEDKWPQLAYEWFADFDANGNDTLDHEEFRELLKFLDIRLTRKQFKILFWAVDLDLSGQVSLFEVFAMIFPELQFSLQAEEKKQRTMRRSFKSTSSDATAVESVQSVFSGSRAASSSSNSNSSFFPSANGSTHHRISGPVHSQGAFDMEAQSGSNEGMHIHAHSLPNARRTTEFVFTPRSPGGSHIRRFQFSEGNIEGDIAKGPITASRQAHDKAHERGHNWAVLEQLQHSESESEAKIGSRDRGASIKKHRAISFDLRGDERKGTDDSAHHGYEGTQQEGPVELTLKLPKSRLRKIWDASASFYSDSDVTARDRPGVDGTVPQCQESESIVTAVAGQGGGGAEVDGELSEEAILALMGWCDVEEIEGLGSQPASASISAPTDEAWHIDSKVGGFKADVNGSTSSAHVSFSATRDKDDYASSSSGRIRTSSTDATTTSGGVGSVDIDTGSDAQPGRTRTRLNLRKCQSLDRSTFRSASSNAPYMLPEREGKDEDEEDEVFAVVPPPPPLPLPHSRRPPLSGSRTRSRSVGAALGWGRAAGAASGTTGGAAGGTVHRRFTVVRRDSVSRSLTV